MVYLVEPKTHTMRRFSLFAFPLLQMAACGTSTPKTTEPTAPKVHTDSVTYTVDGLKDSLVLEGYVAYDENITGPRPGVLIVHEWWGLNDYARMRARELAKLGYIAFALDMYGNGRRGPTPEEAGKLATPFYQDMELARQRFEAAWKALRGFPQTDTARIGAIGYCFGGTQVLNMANLGLPLKAVVSFHGGLQTTLPRPAAHRPAILICHGGADNFVPETEISRYRQMMDSAGITYTFKSYPDATHAFTNPEATAMGEQFKLPIRYNAAADTASWTDMKAFLTQHLR